MVLRCIARNLLGACIVVVAFQARAGRAAEPAGPRVWVVGGLAGDRSAPNGIRHRDPSA